MKKSLAEDDNVLFSMDFPPITNCEFGTCFTVFKSKKKMVVQFRRYQADTIRYMDKTTDGQADRVIQI